MVKHGADIRARSWEHAIELLYQDSWKSDLERFRSNFAYRGLPDVNYNLKTSLIRLGGEFDSLEYHLLRNFRRYSQLEGADLTFSEWKWMTLGQHHGLPTRLLDWSHSPFVALHFATASTHEFDRDGIIWCVDYVECHRRLPRKLRSILAAAGANVFTVGMLEQVTTDLRKFDALSREQFAVFFEPPSLDGRIVNQFALFSVMPSASATIDEWLRFRPSLYRRIVIPKEIKWEIRDKLDQANITERVLFPGLDGLAKWLARHYTPKRSAAPPDPVVARPTKLDHGAAPARVPRKAGPRKATKTGATKATKAGASKATKRRPRS